MRPVIPRCGFTHIEILVTIVVILLIASLILPTLGKVREVSRSTQCKDHLHNLAIAAENYSAHFGVLPPGTLVPHRPVRSVPGGDGFSWLVRLLPFAEQQPLYDQLDWLLPPEQQNRAFYESQIDLFLCPTANVPHEHRPAPSTYAGPHHPVETPIDVDNHGLFLLGRGISPVEIFDGASHTLLIGEKDVPSDDRGWMAGGRSTLRNMERPFMRFRPSTPGATQRDPLAVGGFSSAHPQGGNCALADGSVWLISFEADLMLLRRLTDRRDGEFVSVIDFLPDYIYSDSNSRREESP